MSTDPDSPDGNDPLAAMQVEVTHRFTAPVEAVWQLLSDLERMAGLGPEHTDARWDAPGGPRVGATFSGTNKVGEMEWTVPCTVIECDPPHRLAWTVLDPAEPSSTWTYDLVADGADTVVTQTFRHGPGFSYVRPRVEKHPERAAEIIAGRADMLRANMEATLAAADEVLAAGR